MSLENLRKEIDGLDQELLRLAAERRNVVRRISKIKKKQGLKIKDENREAEMLKRWIEIAENLNLNTGFAEELFKLIIKESIRIQEE